MNDITIDQAIASGNIAPESVNNRIIAASNVVIDSMELIAKVSAKGNNQNAADIMDRLSALMNIDTAWAEIRELVAGAVEAVQVPSASALHAVERAKESYAVTAA